MLSTSFKMTFRRLLRHKGFAFINMAGLAIGTACCLLMMMFVEYELSYDRYHANASRIFRLVRESADGHRSVPAAFILAPTFKSDFPETEVARFFKSRSRLLMSSGEKQFYETHTFWADQEALSIFSWPLLKGNSSTALSDPFSVVISQAGCAPE